MIYRFITEGYSTPANYSDTKEVAKLIELNNEYLKINRYILADKGYTSKEKKEKIEFLEYTDCIMHKNYRGKKLTEFQRKLKKIINKFIVSVERSFGNLKTNYCFFRSKYLCIRKTTRQFLLAAIAYNLKKASTFVS